MRLLDRYLLRELLIPLGYCLGGFLVFWISFDLISQLDEFQEKKLRALDIAEYYLVKMPDLLVVVMPVALLLALLYALTNHARHHELTAIRAAGVSMWRLSIPYLAVGFILSFVLFGVSEYWLPDGAGIAEEILNRPQGIRQNVGAGKWHQNLNFRNDQDNRFWHIAAFNSTTFEMIKPQVEWQLPDGSVRQLFARHAFWTNNTWTFFQAQEFRHFSNPETNAPMILTNEIAFVEFTETPEEIKSEIKVSSLSSISAAKKVRLTISEILDYKRLHPRMDGANRALLDTQFHARFAAPWTCLVVILIALPFGARAGRRNVFVGVAASIFIGFGYFVLQRFGMALGTGGYVPAWLGAWAPNFFFGGVGIFLTQRLR